MISSVTLLLRGWAVCIVCGSVHTSAGARGQRRASGPAELQLQVIVICSLWVLELSLGPLVERHLPWITESPLSSLLFCISNSAWFST